MKVDHKITLFYRQFGLLCCLVIFSAPLWAKTYIFRESDGTIWYTNIKPSASEMHKYQLIGSIDEPKVTAAKKGKKQKARGGCIGYSKAELKKRERQYDRNIQQLSALHGISPYLIKSVIAIESCFDSQAVSTAGAQGLMQLMPATAKDLGVRDSFNPNQNLSGGVSYLRLMLDKYQQNEKLALAAYNAGPHAVDKYNGIPPYKETQAYVKKVLKRYKQYILLANKTQQTNQLVSLR